MYRFKLRLHSSPWSEFEDFEVERVVVASGKTREDAYHKVCEWAIENDIAYWGLQ